MARPSRIGALGSALAAGLLAFLAMVSADSLSRGGSLVFDGIWDAPFVDGLGSFQRRPERELGGIPSRGFRLMTREGVIVARRLPPRTEVQVQMVTGSLAALPALDVDVLANGVLATRASIAHAFRAVEFPATTSAAGDLRIEVRSATGTQERALPLRVSAIAMDWDRPRSPSPTAFRSYALIALSLLAFSMEARTRRRRVVALAFAAGVVLVSVLAGGLYVRGYLPVIATAVTGAAVIGLFGRWVGIAAPSCRWIAILAGARFAFALLPAFTCIDAVFHAHNIHRYQAGQVITSEIADARGKPHSIPYGFTLYALLAPLVPPGDDAGGEGVVRGAMAFLEGTAPIIVFLIMRAGGAAPSVASDAGQIAAALPESLLVLGKGIAANVFGQWVGLWAIFAFLRGGGSGYAVAACAIGVVFATHPGATITLTLLVALWAAILSLDPTSRRRGERIFLALVIGAGVGGLVYYRHVFGMAWDMVRRVGSGAGEARLIAIRWVYVGKVLQDVILKFGAIPPALAAAYWVRRRPHSELDRLLRAWLATFTVFAALAIVTPLALRFEYFLCPAVAMAAAARSPGQRWIQRATILSAAIQWMLAVLVLYGRFDLINVIIPSMRWPLVGIRQTLHL